MQVSVHDSCHLEFSERKFELIHYVPGLKLREAAVFTVFQQVS